MRFVITTGLREELARLVPGAIAGVALGVTSALLFLNHPVEPLDPPLPLVELAPLEDVARGDAEARKRLEANPPPAEVRAVGSAFLAWNAAASSGMDPRDPRRDALGAEMRSALGLARDRLGGEAQLAEVLRDLRAYHAELFVDELRRLRKTEQRSEELKRLAGGLLDVLSRTGWLDERGRTDVPEGILRARYKLHWTSIVYSLEDCEHAPPAVCYAQTSLPLAASELRALLAFLIARPVVRDEDVAEAGGPERAVDRRRLVYLERLVALDRYADPAGREHPFVRGFPVELARGALQFKLGRYDLAAEHLGRWAAAHPDDMRAKNWYLGAIAKIQGD